MPYATEQNIKDEIRGLDLDGESAVTAQAVVDFIDEADALINMYIGKRYTTPITDTTSALVLKTICIDIVVYRVTKIITLSRSIPIPDSKVVQEITEGTAYKRSMRFLADIRDDKMNLPDSTLTDTNSGLESFHTDSGNTAIDPCFEKGTKQW